MRRLRERGRVPNRTTIDWPRACALRNSHRANTATASATNAASCRNRTNALLGPSEPPWFRPIGHCVARLLVANACASVTVRAQNLVHPFLSLVSHDCPLVAAKPDELHHRRHDQHDGHDRQHGIPTGNTMRVMARPPCSTTRARSDARNPSAWAATSAAGASAVLVGGAQGRDQPAYFRHLIPAIHLFERLDKRRRTALHEGQGPAQLVGELADACLGYREQCELGDRPAARAILS